MLRIEKPLREKMERLAEAWSMSMSGAIRRLIVEAKVPKAEE